MYIFYFLKFLFLSILRANSGLPMLQWFGIFDNKEQIDFHIIQIYSIQKGNIFCCITYILYPENDSHYSRSIYCLNRVLRIFVNSSALFVVCNSMGNESQSIVPRTKGLLWYFVVALDMTLKTIFIFLQVRYTGFFKYICCLDLEYISFNSCICLRCSRLNIQNSLCNLSIEICSTRLYNTQFLPYVARDQHKTGIV